MPAGIGRGGTEAFNTMRGVEDMGHERCAEIVADLLFAYVNKDEGFPHAFEVRAVEQAVEFLKKHYKGEKFTNEWFERRLYEIKKYYD